MSRRKISFNPDYVITTQKHARHEFEFNVGSQPSGPIGIQPPFRLADYGTLRRRIAPPTGH